MIENFFDVWNGKILNKYRKKHLSSRRDIAPCNKCNADGKIHGSNHAKIWHKKFKIFNNL